MFEDLIREIGNLNGREVTVSVPKDADGYLDRECPANDCQFVFKIYGDDWESKVRDEEVFCPFCRHTAAADHWWTKEQIEYAKEAAFSQVVRGVNAAMKRDATRWNQRQPRNSLIRITLDVKDTATTIDLPSATVEAMRLKITCPACACRYAVIGTAYFCPACGHNAVEENFAQSIQAYISSLNAIPVIRQSFPDKHVAEDTIRLLTESVLKNAVTIFQCLAEALIAKRPHPPNFRRNAFQNLGEGSDLWNRAFGKTYESHLSAAELESLNRYFQQRHALAHKDGIVDADYLLRSRDAAYQVGQRLTVKEPAARECLGLIEKLGSGLKADCS